MMKRNQILETPIMNEYIDAWLTCSTILNQSTT